ncbi:MAG: M67 family metallopeptidase [Bacteroidia bacterium]|nr:M67 family metallopeptidase [Bacteroidia bacterium]MDW8158127.1 M67 family metallopeptidase [Bacteroidia bacterium]
MKTITFTSPAWDYILMQAIKDFPHETCGFFFGFEEEDRRCITQAMAVKNASIENKERRFSINSQDYIRAEKFALQNHTTLLGIYHSHPNHPAHPSLHDLNNALPFFSYLIVSVYDKIFHQATCWRLNEEGERSFHEEELILPS